MSSHRLQVHGDKGPTEVQWQDACAAGNEIITNNPTTVVFFEGDQVDDDARELLGPQRCSPEGHLASLRSCFGPDARLLIVQPTRLAPGGQACYSNLLGPMTACGEALGFRPQGYRAATHLAALLAACGGGGGEGG
ncbi:hypothetical protein Agub_g1660, partial [Astrephomene gubernaculifera]